MKKTAMQEAIESMDKEKRLYQLLIQVQLDEDWVGTVWYSRLYPSRKECIKGCLKNEIKEIVDIVQMNHQYAANVKQVKQWLQGDDETMYDENDPLPFYWEIISHTVAD